MAQRRSITAKILICMALAGVASVVAVAATRLSLGWAGSVLEKRYPPPGQMISVGNYRLHLYCFGTGSPTVIIEPGMGLDWTGWRFVIARLTPLYRICVY